jgi:hypothetical protein
MTCGNSEDVGFEVGEAVRRSEEPLTLTLSPEYRGEGTNN